MTSPEGARLSAGKICVSCGNMWAPAFRFCPVDGLSLTEEVHPVPTESAGLDDPQKARKGSGRLLDIPPVQAAGPTTDRLESRVKPGPGAIAGPRTKRQSKQIGPNAATLTDTQAARPEITRDPTLVERPAISAEEGKAAAKPGRAPAEAPPRSPASKDKQKDVRAPAAVMKSAPERTPDTGPMERVQAKAKADSRSTSRPESAAKPEKSEKKARKGFSETAWFMRVVDPNAVDPNTGKVKIDEDAYKRDKAVPVEKRRLFSLGSKPAEPEEET